MQGYENTSTNKDELTMVIMGLQKTTLLDYPHTLAATVFLGGCDFICPYCHNSELIFHPKAKYSKEEILEFLNKRQNILDGVCITGGEPTLSPDLIDFIKDIKKLPYKVKLDTNGNNPSTLKYLVENSLIDYVAMDLKTTLSNYPNYFINHKDSADKIEESIQFLLSNAINYEFRTTITKELHPLSDLCEMTELIKDAPFYYLQNFRNVNNVVDSKLNPYSDKELDNIIEVLKKINPRIARRGDYI